jgi:aminopeptidase N
MKRAICFFLVLAWAGLTGCGDDADFDSESGSAGTLFTERGITDTLAADRASRIESVRYLLHFDLDRGSAEAGGVGTIAFRLKETPPQLIVDFGMGRLKKLTVNGRVIDEPRQVHDHIVIPGDMLRAGGENKIVTRFTVPVGRGGTPLTRFFDESDGTEYLYTLLVPADAHFLFPCFDQPDLKAKLSLSLSMPKEWTATSNARALRDTFAGGRRTMIFDETQLLSTYLMAFAAGDYVRIEDKSAAASDVPMTCYVRRSKRAKAVSADLFRLNREALEWCEDYFGVPYPFAKFDFVLAPGFPYGGMEHAATIFYRETAAAFDQEPTASQLLSRAILFYHEVSHQWFGDLVTMAWFDDLWLKEGFATFISYKILDSIDPAAFAWLRFHQRVKPAAYRVDATEGTTPVYQELDNLFNAKSSYGAIVYKKAPALLQQLEFLIGEEAFREGTRACLNRYAFDSVRWPDVFACYEVAAGHRLDEWLDAWLLTRGMPVVTVDWATASDGTIARLDVVQKPARGSGTLWPIKTMLALWYPGGRVERLPVSFATERHSVEGALGRDAPEFVFVNDGDFAYGRFLLDDMSRDSVTALLPVIDDPFLKSLLLGSLWDMVREAVFDPAEFVDLALAELAREEDAVTFANLLGKISVALTYYLGARQLDDAVPRVEAFLLAKIEAPETPTTLRLSAYRAFVNFAETEESIAWLKKLFAGEVSLEGIPLASRDRWRIAGRLAEVGDPQAVEFFVEEEKKGGVDAPRYAFQERSAFADAEIKKEYFDAYLTESDWAEQWIEASLYTFNTVGQDEFTLPYLRRALDKLEWVKEHRKIFFMPRWIGAFVGGHTSREALDVVRGFLKERSDLARDIRLKLLQTVDGLERTVRIREKYAR